MKRGSESVVPRIDEWADLDTTKWSIDEIISIPGGTNNHKYESLKFDHDYQNKQEIINDEIYTHVNGPTDELQTWFAKNGKNPYDEWDSDYRKKLNTWLSK